MQEAHKDIVFWATWLRNRSKSYLTRNTNRDSHRHPAIRHKRHNANRSGGRRNERNRAIFICKLADVIDIHVEGRGLQTPSNRDTVHGTDAAEHITSKSPSSASMRARGPGRLCLERSRFITTRCVRACEAYRRAATRSLCETCPSPTGCMAGRSPSSCRCAAGSSRTDCATG